MFNRTFDELKASGRLPSPPGVGMRILTLTRNEDYSAEDLARVIMTDPALTGRLIKLANSVATGSVERVATVRDAATRLGAVVVKNVALGLSLVSAHRSGACRAFDYDRFWSASLARAVAAQNLAPEFRCGNSAEAWVLGLLADIGRLALASVHPEAYARLLDRAAGQGRPAIAKLEREAFEIDHAEVGACLLAEWGLPAPFGQALRSYEHLLARRGPAADPQQPLGCLLSHAELITEVCIADCPASDPAWTRYSENLEDLRQRLALNQAQFVALCAAIARQWSEWGQILSVPTQNVPSVPEIHLRAQRCKLAQAPGPTPAAASTPLRDAASAAAPVATAPRPVPAASLPAPAGPAPAPAHAPAVAAAAVPLVPAEGAVAAAAGAAAAAVPKPRLRILAVDDDPLALRLLHLALRRTGHAIELARDGEEALGKVLANPPHMLISDWMMPKMDGLELCRQVRRIESMQGIFFLLVTGRAEEDDVLVEAFDAGVDDYVTKPFSPRALQARLRSGERVIALQQQLAKEKSTVELTNADLHIAQRRLQDASLTDVLTELPNRRFAIERLQEEWAAGDQKGAALSLVMIDIDHFKRVNDEHGHDIGDLVLKEVAGILRDGTRHGEHVVRLGGEEFLLICPGATAAQATVAAERLRKAVGTRRIRGGSFDGSVTASLGVAQRTGRMQRWEELLKAADEAVYAAKTAGRNRTCLAPDGESPRALSA